jgi:EmrB/QacA subfamily drug resistance transporter
VVRSAGVTADQEAVPRHGGRSLALAVLCTILFLTFLDNTVVSVALGSVQTDLRAGVSSLQWVVGAYALTFAAAMLAFGMVSDEFGRKRVMLAGAGIFCAGSVVCALAPNTGVLIAGRAVMGFGAAASEPGTLSMLRHLYTNERIRNRALGWWTAVSGLALALGPVIGGALIGLWTSIAGAVPPTLPGTPPGPNPDSWRAIFWFNLVLGLFALIAGAVVLPENSDPDAHRVDISGTVLGAGALTAFAFAVINAESDGFGAPVVIGLLCISAVAGVAFFYREKRAAHPLLDLKYLRVPRFLTANVVAFCAYFATFAVFFFTALYLYEVANETGYKIALTFLPMTVLMILASVLAGRWTTTVGAAWSILIGCLLFSAGLVLTTITLNPNPSYAPLALALVLTGVGVGSTVVPITSSALSAVPPERSGMAASATNTSREIGAVTGIAVLGSLVNSQLRSSLTASMVRLHIPDTFQAIAIHVIETGGLTGGSGASSVGSQGSGDDVLIVEMTHAAYNAFYDGLRAALVVSAILVFAAGIFGYVMARRRHPADQEFAPGS